jgi:hypothetical protein
MQRLRLMKAAAAAGPDVIVLDLAQGCYARRARASRSHAPGMHAMRLCMGAGQPRRPPLANP